MLQKLTCNTNTFYNLESFFRKATLWLRNHPARAASLAGWYQQICGIFATLFTLPLIIQNLTANESGIWFTFQGFLAVIALSDFGISYVIARQVAYSLGQGKREDSDDFIHTEPGWTGIAEI